MEQLTDEQLKEALDIHNEAVACVGLAEPYAELNTAYYASMAAELLERREAERMGGATAETLPDSEVATLARETGGGGWHALTLAREVQHHRAQAYVRAGQLRAKDARVAELERELAAIRARASDPKQLMHVLTRGAEQGKGLEALMDYLKDGRLP